jgi:MFS family permease
LIPLRQRGVYQGYGNIVFALGAALGGPLGGVFGDTVGWKWAFLIQVPLCVVHAAVVWFKVDIPAGPGSMIEKIKRIDVFGAITLVGGIAFFILAASLGGNEYPWGHPLVYGTFIAAVVFLVAFVLVEKYVARQPVMPLQVLFTRTPGFVSLTNWFISMSQFGILYNVPMYHIAVGQQSSGRSGAYLIPNAVLASTASLLCGFYIARTGKYRTLLISLAVLGVIGPFCMTVRVDIRYVLRV